MKNNNRSFIERLYSNKLAMFIVSVLLNVALVAFIIWLSRFAKIKGDIFAVVIGSVVVIGLFLNVLFLMAYSKNLKLFRQLFLGFASVMLVVSLLGGFYIIRAERSLGKLVDGGGEETVEFSVISFSEEFTEENMGNNSIGYMKQSEEFETIFKEKVRDHSRTIQYVEYQNYNDLLQASLDGDIQYGLVPLNYGRLAEDFESNNQFPFEKSHVLFSFSTLVSGDFSNVDVIKEPFTVLLLGNNEGLSDSIILATVNPSTLRVTMTSLARDSYVPIACYPGQTRDKLNHSRGRGRQCLVDTVENFLDVEVDFFFETDFYALEKIVDALGGLEIDSPIAFAGSFPVEGKPNKYDPVSVPKGLNLLNGKQTVTFARERHHMPSGDFDRQLNQQYVIREIASKLIRERNPERLVQVLEGASNNLVMSFSIDDLTSLLGYAINQSNLSALDPMSTFRIVQTQVTGTTPMINGMSVIVPYKEDIENARRVIKDNLKTTVDLNKETSFNFSIKKPFSLASRPKFSGTTVDVGPIEDTKEFEVPKFTSGFTKDEIKAWGKNKGVEINFRVIGKDSPDFKSSYENGQVIHQTIDPGIQKKKPDSIGISIVEFKEEVKPPVEVKPDPKPETPTPEPPTPEKPKPEEPTEFPQVGWSRDRLMAWIEKYKQYDVTVSKINEDKGGTPRVTYVDRQDGAKNFTVTLDYDKITPE